MSEKKIQFELPIVLQIGETTWRVLLALLRAGKPLGPKEVTETLSLSSRSVGLYHLEKLHELEMVEKNHEGEYRIKPDADLGFLEQYLFFERGAIPRIALYAAFSTVLLAFYVATVPFDFGAHNVYALAFGIIFTAFFWFETFRIYPAITQSTEPA
ncbi:hypothetical protein EU546_07170 [Candidatus Thorarchaeota archaeon]|nr:MAG: hypothetical protein EU546_07170 [Candidatus Thorarchaeota archaeon]